MPNDEADRPQPGGAVVGGVCFAFAVSWSEPSWSGSVSSAGLGSWIADGVVRISGDMRNVSVLWLSLVGA